MLTPDKLQKLAEYEGYDDIESLLEERHTDSVIPGMCTNRDCEYTVEVEPDQSHGWCEECETNTVESPLISLGII